MPQATQAELQAILHGAAIAPLGAPSYELFARSFLRITGSDATRWLNGMVTNSIQALQPGEGNYNFLLNAQGRIQADCTIYREPHENEPTFLLEADSSQMEAITNTLDRFIIMDDVELQAVPDTEHGLVILGTHAPALLREHHLLAVPQPSHMTLYEESHDRVQVSAAPDSRLPQFHVFSRFAKISSLLMSLQIVMREVSPAALEAVRILSGTPRFGQDIRDRDLPQETNQTHALHFSKGCYLGQEIVERIRSRGQVHRQFTRFRLTGDLPTTFPVPLQADSKPAGELTSAALVPLPEGPQIFALGYTRREFLEATPATRRELTYPGGTAIPRSASDSLTPNTDNRERTTESSHA